MNSSKRSLKHRDKKTTKTNEADILCEIAKMLKIWNKAGPGENEDIRGWGTLSPKGRKAAETSLFLLYDNADLLHRCASDFGTNHQTRIALNCLDSMISGITKREEITRYRGWGREIASLGFISDLRQCADKKCINIKDLTKARDIKKRFHFNEAQAFFDGEDLELPSGDTVSILKKLVESFGEVVKHKELDQNSTLSNASDILKGQKHTIAKALGSHKIPCEIVAKRGVGYVLQQTKTTSS